MPHALPSIDVPTFETLGPGVTLLDFTATWCPPCRVLGMTLRGLAGDYSGRVQFFAVDVDVVPALAERFGVRAMPTLVVWRDGREVGRIVGNRPRRFVADVLDQVLADGDAVTRP